MSRRAEPSGAETRGGAMGRPYTGWLFLCVVFALLMFVTRPLYIGDTYWYVLDIRASLGLGWTASSRLWDFPHVLWRPLGRLLSLVSLGPLLPIFDRDAQVSITLLLVCLSAVSALICGLVVQTAVLKMTGRRWVSTLVAGSFLCLGVVLNYSRSGSSYLPGLACSTLAIYFGAFHSETSRRMALCSGFLAGLAVLFWAPYLVSLPATLLAGPVLNIDGNRRKRILQLSTCICLAAGATAVSFYLLAIIARNIDSWPALLAWVGETSGNPQRDRKLLRMATGLPRSFYELGTAAVWIKWYLFKDPYASVGLLDLVRVSLGKLAIFYAAIATLTSVLWTSPKGRKLLLLIVAIALPHFGMALTYESGSPERYLPALPVVFMGFGYAIGSADFGRWTRVLIAALCCAHVPVNLVALSARSVNRGVGGDVHRIAALTSLRPSSRLYVIAGSDSLFELQYGAPFEPINRRPLPAIATITPLGSRVSFWRRDFACGALSVWDHGGEVWVTRRVLSERPVRAWLWVEGDDRRWSWAAIRGFFQDFDSGKSRGGDDGFFLLGDTAENRSILLRNVPDGNPQRCSAGGTGVLEVPAREGT
jgi:hypothetical protein